MDWAMYTVSFASGCAIGFLFFREYQKRVNKPIARIIDFAVIEEKLTKIFELRGTLFRTMEEMESETEDLFTQLENIKDLEYKEKIEDKEAQGKEN